jgi:hypothetical protein
LRLIQLTLVFPVLTWLATIWLTAALLLSGIWLRALDRHLHVGTAKVIAVLRKIRDITLWKISSLKKETVSASSCSRALTCLTICQSLEEV